MKNNIMIVLLLSCMSSASIAAMDEVMVQLEEAPIGEASIVGPIQLMKPKVRPLNANELAIVLSMPNDVRFRIMRGVTWQCYTNEGKFLPNQRIKTDRWVNNKQQTIDSINLDQYQDYNSYIAQFNRKQSSDYAQL